jgi:hypothetical protein
MALLPYHPIRGITSQKRAIFGASWLKFCIRYFKVKRICLLLLRLFFSLPQSLWISLFWNRCNELGDYDRDESNVTGEIK